MAALSDYLESGLLHHVFRGETFAKPVHVAVALTSGVIVDSDTGVIKHFGDFHRIPFGEIDGGKTERVKSISQLDKLVKFDFE